MMTVHGYEWSEPVVEEPKPQGPGLMTYALLAVAAWWAWKQGWLKKLGKAGGGDTGGQA